MSDPRRVADVFSDALERPAEERSEFLDAACGADADVRAEVESLLAAHESSGGFLGALPDAARSALLGPAAADAPREVGPYRTVRELGRGGMGIVYLAERADGGFRQQVALKLIKRGMDSDAIVDRFLRERQILAGLDHPSVARLLDGGVTADGQPYFAMEFIDGTPLTAHCDARRLGVDDRLRLFEATCRAVQYAHGRLVVHRDLKPSNILVTAEGTPKLLDFGVAKLLQEDGGVTPPTRTHERLMTPEYAAPEQVRGAPVTTATDVYALGVVLYELLTARLPFGPARLGDRPDEEREPSPPSAAALVSEPGSRADDRAAARGLTPARLARRLAGDLDVITLHALRREPERRYASAEALAEAVRRHLAGLTVQARRDTLGYRTTSFVRRHRLGVAAAVTVLASLLLGLVGTTYQARRAAREAARAREVQRFLVGVFEGADPTHTLGESVSARQLLDEGARRLEREAGDDEGARAELADTLARTYRSLGLLDAAGTWAERAVDGFRKQLGPAHPRTVLAELTAAEVRTDRGDAVGTLPEVDRLVPLVQSGFGRDSAEHVRARRARAALLMLSSDLQDALAETRAIQAALARSLGEDHVETAAAEGEVGTVLADMSRFGEAETTLRSAFDRLFRAGGLNSPQGIKLETSLADVLEAIEKKDEATRHFQAALGRARTLLGPRHPLVAEILIKYGFLMIGTSDADAERALTEALSILEPLGHYEAGAALQYLGFVYVGQERLDEARDAFVRAEAILRQKGGPEDPVVLSTSASMAYVQARLGDVAGAEARLKATIAALTRRNGGPGHELRAPRRYLGEVMRMQGRVREAESVHREVLAMERELFGGDTHAALAATRHQIALDLLASEGRGALGEARTLVDAAIAAVRAPEPEPRRLADYLITSGRIAFAAGDRARARADLDEAIPLLVATRGESAPSTRLARRVRADVR